MSKHVCGLQGYDPMLGDRCPGCDNSPDLLSIQEELMGALGTELAKSLDDEIMKSVDPDDFNLYDAIYVKSRSVEMKTETENVIEQCEWCGEDGHEEENCPDADINDGADEFTVREFVSRLETFLESELNEITRGNVFLAENGEGVSMNILIGAPFAFSDDEINQINVIIAPTDREFLGSEGVSMDDRVDAPSFDSGMDVQPGGFDVEVVEKSKSGENFDSAMKILDD